MIYQNIQIFFEQQLNQVLVSFSKLNNALSKRESASLTDPSEILTISFKASSDTFPFSLSLIFL